MLQASGSRVSISHSTTPSSRSEQPGRVVARIDRPDVRGRVERQFEDGGRIVAGARHFGDVDHGLGVERCGISDRQLDGVALVVVGLGGRRLERLMRGRPDNLGRAVGVSGAPPTKYVNAANAAARKSTKNPSRAGMVKMTGTSAPITQNIWNLVSKRAKVRP